jgi:phosphoglycerate dehydrogenase-like enzyme
MQVTSCQVNSKVNAMNPSSVNIAILDDYQAAALLVADWSVVKIRANVTTFQDHLADEAALAERLAPFDAICVMRERTPMTATLLKLLPRLKLIASTGPVNAAIDTQVAEGQGIAIAHTGYSSAPTIELTWALILTSMRNICSEAASLRSGGWQRGVGADLDGKTLGIIGLGNVGKGVAKVALAFGTKVIAWSKNLSTEAASESGAVLVSKEELLRTADVVSLHTVLSRRTVGMIGVAELALMTPTAHLINTSRGRLVVEEALLAALAGERIARAAIAVYDVEPLPTNHPDRLLATPHIGYVTHALYQRFYQDVVAHFITWLDSTAVKGPMLA